MISAIGNNSNLDISTDVGTPLQGMAQANNLISPKGMGEAAQNTKGSDVGHATHTTSNPSIDTEVISSC